MKYRVVENINPKEKYIEDTENNYLRKIKLDVACGLLNEYHKRLDFCFKERTKDIDYYEERLNHFQKEYEYLKEAIDSCKIVYDLRFSGATNVYEKREARIALDTIHDIWEQLGLIYLREGEVDGSKYIHEEEYKNTK